jgi:hypothetical protein
MMKDMWKLAAVAAITAAGLTAQTGGGGVVSPFQQASQMGQGAGGGVTPRLATGGGSVTMTATGRMGQQTVVGKPFSATEERKTVQTLGDGTQLENSDSNLFYRDSQGRTRVEQTVNGRTRILISDPVDHTNIVLDPTTKTARKNSLMAQSGQAMPTAVMRSGGAGGGGAGGAAAGPVVAAGGGGGAGGRVGAAYADGYVAGQARAIRDLNLNTENLGVQTVNGVAADGTRVTQVVLAGQIGNNRDIHIVNERWYSGDLQLLVKTVNSDPRFGVTTYEMTKIVQGVQDPALFQIPADYTVSEPGR